MTKAPERIFVSDVLPSEDDWGYCSTTNDWGHGATEYLRADLAPSPEAVQQMREALEEMTDLARALTSKHICINGQYVEVREAISRARAALKAAEGE